MINPKKKTKRKSRLAPATNKNVPKERTVFKRWYFFNTNTNSPERDYKHS